MTYHDIIALFAAPPVEIPANAARIQALAARVAATIAEENVVWEGRGGTSAEVWSLGLRPAFAHRWTGEVFFDPDAPVHLSRAVPREYWLETDAEGDLRRLDPAIEQGFVFPEHPDEFYTREEAAAMLRKRERGSWPSVWFS